MAFNESTRIINADKLLKLSAKLWYACAVIGLTAFFIYVLVHYGGAVLAPESTSTESSFIAGDTVGNFFLATHLSLALIVISGGLVQLLPKVRSRYPSIHRWNGRLFSVCAVLCSLAGQYLIFTRDIPGTVFMDLGTSTAGVLVLFFTALAVTAARRKQFVEHRRWALRLFLVANAGWFFRIFLMLWLAVNQGPVGFDPQTFSGPALTFLAYAQFLLPLAVLQLYLVAERGGNVMKFCVASIIGVAALITLLGVTAASLMMWFPIF